MVVVPYNDTPVVMRIWPVMLIAFDDHGAQALEEVVQNANGPSRNFSTYRTIADMDCPFGRCRDWREVLRNTGDGFMVEVFRCLHI